MLNTLLLFIVFFLFFSYVLYSVQVLFGMAIIILVGICMCKKFNDKILMQKEALWWIGCIGINVIGMINTCDIKKAISFNIIICIFIILKILLSNTYKWIRVFVSSCLLLSGVHIIATIIQRFNPNIIRSINGYILNNRQFIINDMQLSMGKYPGITAQIGANAFYISIFISIIFIYAFIENNKINKAMLSLICIAAIYGLVLTGKRGFVVANIISIIIILMLHTTNYLREKRKVLVYISIIAIFVLMLVICIHNTFRGQDITSGRIEIYKMTWEIIKNSPILGNGIGYVKNVIGIEVHNIYLQLWAELGIVGLCIYILAIVKTFITTVQISYWTRDKNKMSIKDKQYIISSLYIQIIFIVYGFTGNPLYDYFEFAIYIISTAIPISIYIYHKRKFGNTSFK